MKCDDGRLYVIAGASRSGKTAWTKRQVQRDRRVIAWDPEDQWAQLPGWTKVTSRPDLVRRVQTAGPLKLAFVAGGNLAEGFDLWAGCVMHSGRYFAPLSCVAEELADVTTPSKAPGNWGILLRRGLKRGISIYAISQRWAEADKTAVGNASAFVLFRMSSGDDITYMSRKTRVPVTELDGLKPLEWVNFDAVNGNISRGKLRF
jgi:hypothetical protein